MVAEIVQLQPSKRTPSQRRAPLLIEFAPPIADAADQARAPIAWWAPPVIAAMAIGVWFMIFGAVWFACALMAGA